MQDEKERAIERLRAQREQVAQGSEVSRAVGDRGGRVWVISEASYADIQALLMTAHAPARSGTFPDYSHFIGSARLAAARAELGPLFDWYQYQQGFLQGAEAAWNEIKPRVEQ
jgi:hypothetical protein